MKVHNGLYACALLSIIITELVYKSNNDCLEMIYFIV